MIFGFGPVGYGPARTEKMLATPNALERIDTASNLLHASGAAEAHRFLINPAGRLAWCRTPFISKFLYFDGYGRCPGAQPLIFDQFVRDRLEIMGHPLRLHYTDDYVKFCELAATLAAEMDPPLNRPDIVELALFRG
jgi:hypothetical protein